MTTIREVAKRAHVSAMTVSRVLNNAAHISRPARQRVEAAIAELGYVPNELARSLRFKQTNTLALVLTDITNPFFTTVARGVEDAASDAGFNVIFCNTDESESEQQEHLTILVRKQVDGVLLVPARSTSEALVYLQERQVPVVVLDRRIENGSADLVRCDSAGGAYGLTRLLIELGHRRIAILTGSRDVSTAVDRVAGYRRALDEAGAPGDERYMIYGEFTQASGAEMVRQALRLSPPPTALFAANNFIAIGAYRALRAEGYEIPGQISLVAFDDLPAGLVMDPFLTVAAQPAYEMGRKATELLLARLAGAAPAPPQEIIMPTEIIVRRSSGPPADHLAGANAPAKPEGQRPAGPHSTDI